MKKFLGIVIAVAIVFIAAIPLVACGKKKTDPTAAISKISVTKRPTINEYWVGEEVTAPKYTGMRIVVRYMDGSYNVISEKYEEAGITFDASNFSTAAAGEVEIGVALGSSSTKFKVEVKQKPILADIVKYDDTGVVIMVEPNEDDPSNPSITKAHYYIELGTYPESTYDTSRGGETSMSINSTLQGQPIRWFLLNFDPYGMSAHSNEDVIVMSEYSLAYSNMMNEGKIYRHTDIEKWIGAGFKNTFLNKLSRVEQELVSSIIPVDLNDLDTSIAETDASVNFFVPTLSMFADIFHRFPETAEELNSLKQDLYDATFLKIGKISSYDPNGETLPWFFIEQDIDGQTTGLNGVGDEGSDSGCGVRLFCLMDMSDSDFTVAEGGQPSVASNETISRVEVVNGDGGPNFVMKGATLDTDAIKNSIRVRLGYGANEAEVSYQEFKSIFGGEYEIAFKEYGSSEDPIAVDAINSTELGCYFVIPVIGAEENAITPEEESGLYKLFITGYAPGNALTSYTIDIDVLAGWTTEEILSDSVTIDVNYINHPISDTFTEIAHLVSQHEGEKSFDDLGIIIEEAGDELENGLSGLAVGNHTIKAKINADIFINFTVNVYEMPESINNEEAVSTENANIKFVNEGPVYCPYTDKDAFNFDSNRVVVSFIYGGSTKSFDFEPSKLPSKFSIIKPTLTDSGTYTVELKCNDNVIDSYTIIVSDPIADSIKYDVTKDLYYVEMEKWDSSCLRWYLFNFNPSLTTNSNVIAIADNTVESTWNNANNALTWVDRSIGNQDPEDIARWWSIKLENDELPNSFGPVLNKANIDVNDNLQFYMPTLGELQSMFGTETEGLESSTWTYNLPWDVTSNALLTSTPSTAGQYYALSSSEGEITAVSIDANSNQAQFVPIFKLNLDGITLSSVIRTVVNVAINEYTYSYNNGSFYSDSEMTLTISYSDGISESFAADDFDYSGFLTKKLSYMNGDVEVEISDTEFASLSGGTDVKVEYVLSINGDPARTYTLSEFYVHIVSPT